MKEITRGKSKIILDPQDGTNELILQFTGDQTVNEKGEIDPGANFVLANVTDEEKRRIAESVIGMSTFFFQALERGGIPTHFISADPANLQMRVKAGKPLGQGVELIQRYYAYGSLLKRFEGYFRKWQPIDLREFHHKNDEAGDPPMSLDIILAARILTTDEYYAVRRLLGDASAVIRDELAKKDLTLIDIKLEVFIVEDEDGLCFVVGDEIAGGSMRVASADKTEIKDKGELARLILG